MATNPFASEYFEGNFDEPDPTGDLMAEQPTSEPMDRLSFQAETPMLIQAQDVHDHLSFRNGQQPKATDGSSDSMDDSDIDSFNDSESIMMEASFAETSDGQCQTDEFFFKGGIEAACQTEICYNKGFHIYRSPTRTRDGSDDSKRKLLKERESSIKRLIQIEQKLNSSMMSRDNAMWDESEDG